MFDHLKETDPGLLRIMFQSPWKSRNYFRLKALLTPRLHDYMVRQGGMMTASQIFTGFNEEAAQRPDGVPLPDIHLTTDVLKELVANHHAHDKKIISGPDGTKASLRNGEKPQPLMLYKAFEFQRHHDRSTHQQAAYMKKITASSVARARSRRESGKLTLPKRHARRRARLSSFEHLAIQAGLPPLASTEEVPGECVDEQQHQHMTPPAHDAKEGSRASYA